MELPDSIQELLNNKYVLIFGQWIVATIVVNFFGDGIISSWYKNLLPKTKYIGYDRKNHQSIYIDNIEDYACHC